jgi:hypothetical protein
VVDEVTCSPNCAQVIVRIYPAAGAVGKWETLQGSDRYKIDDTYNSPEENPRGVAQR